MTARCNGAALLLLVCAAAWWPARGGATVPDTGSGAPFSTPAAAGLPQGLTAISPTLTPTQPLSLPVLSARAEPVEAAAARPSGLGWRSGVACWDGSFDRYRNRPSDVYVHFVGRSTRRGVVRAVRNSYTGAFARRPGRLSLSFPMLTNEDAGQFAQCASGKFDNYVKDVANALRKHGFRKPIIRIGWEPNGSFPWSLGDWPHRADGYIRCFRRQAKIFRSRLPDADIDWTNRRTNALPYSVERIYPGDRYVDIIGLMVYDRWPVHRNQADWDRAYWMRDRWGGPKGLGSYLQMARDHGKKLSIPEWAVSNNRNDPSSFDNPFFVDRMRKFFKNHSKILAYEAYFNCGSAEAGGRTGGYRLSPRTSNPRTAAAYRRIWQP
jgi:hypothetical protein